MALMVLYAKHKQIVCFLYYAVVYLKRRNDHLVIARNKMENLDIPAYIRKRGTTALSARVPNDISKLLQEVRYDEKNAYGREPSTSDIITECLRCHLPVIQTMAKSYKGGKIE